MGKPFSDAALGRLAADREVRIETRGADGATHRTIVWAVVDGGGRVLVRSWRGSGARWYREAISGRPVALVIGRDVLAVEVDRATDPERVAACSEWLTRKYAGDPSTPSMLREEILDTTLELRPV